MSRISRNKNLCKKIVIIDGQPGCGKTMLSPIVASLDRVEKLSYLYELEWICSLNHLHKINDRSSEVFINLLLDLRLYNNMMSRDVNFRPGDLSSIFSDINPYRYAARLLSDKKDENIPEIINKENPILNITTHNLLPFSKPVFNVLKDRLIFIKMVRNPIDMITQQSINMDKILETSRDFSIYKKYGKREIPFYINDGEEFLNANPMEKCILCIERLNKLERTFKEDNPKFNVITIKFEDFVLNPDNYMNLIVDNLDTKITDNTREMMKRQKVPRDHIDNGIDLSIYRRCGWKPKNERTFNRENINISVKYQKMLDKLCNDYKKEYEK